MRHRSVCAALAGLLLAATAAQAAVTYTMNQAGFSPTWSQYTQHTVGAGGFGISYGLTSGGNPLEHRAFETTVNAAPSGSTYSAYYISLLFSGAYDPAIQGAVPNITYREDFRTTSSIQISGPVVRQNGNFYFAPVLTVSAANWTSSNLLSLTASDFYLVTNNSSLAGGLNPSSNPDFSASGAVIEFGMFRGSDTGPIGGGSGDSAVGFVDNVVLTVPTPGAAGLLGLVGALAARRRR